MNFIYGVICHQLTHSLVFLVNELLKSPHSIILIHVDQKADLASFHTQFGQHDQVYFLADRTDVRWGSYSQIEVMLKLLQEAQNMITAIFSSCPEMTFLYVPIQQENYF